MAADLGLERGMEYVRSRMCLRVEYQTLQRLPESRHIFFTVRCVCAGRWHWFRVFGR